MNNTISNVHNLQTQLELISKFIAFALIVFKNFHLEILIKIPNLRLIWEAAIEFIKYKKVGAGIVQ